MCDCIVRGRTFSATPLGDRRMSGRANLSLWITQTHTQTHTPAVSLLSTWCVRVCLCVFMQMHISVPVSFMLLTATFLLGLSTHRGLTQKVDRGETRPQKVHNLIWHKAVGHSCFHVTSARTSQWQIQAASQFHSIRVFIH